MPTPTERLEINVTARPEDAVFTGLLSESGSSPSRKVSWLGGAWGTFSDHCTPEQSFQSQGDDGLFEAYMCRAKLEDVNPLQVR